MKLILTDIEDFDFEIEGEHKVINPQGNIKHCIGCFGCWAKTPGECVIHDGYERTSLDMGLCDEMIIVSECYYGTVSPFVKAAQDRAISYVQGDFIIKNGEMHHKHRYTNHFKLSAHFYGDDITEDEKKTAKDIIAGNAENFDADFEGVYFYKSKDELKGLKL